MSSLRFIPSSYCQGVLETEDSDVPRLNALDDLEASSPAPVRTAVTATPLKRAAKEVTAPPPPPAVPAREPEPIFSTYAQGAVLPRAYYYPYIKTERPIMAPASHQPVPMSQQEIATPKAHFHDEETCPYRQQFTPKKLSANATPRREPVDVPQHMAGANLGYSYEPSSYAFPQLDEQYARSAVSHRPLAAKKSIYAPLHEVDEGMPSATPTCERSTMESTQLNSIQINGQQNCNQVQQDVYTPQASTPQQGRVHFSNVQQHNTREEPYPKTPIGYNMAAVSTYMGGVPNDLMPAYGADNVPLAYQQNYQSPYRQNPSAGVSGYHFSHYKPTPINSTITADIHEAETTGRARSTNHGAQGLNNMAQIGTALNEIRAQIPGNAFAPLNMPPCSEYQFDQLQDLTSCF